MVPVSQEREIQEVSKFYQVKHDYIDLIISKVQKEEKRETVLKIIRLV